MERAVQVLAWFYSRMDLFFPEIQKTKKRLRPTDDTSDSEEESEDSEESFENWVKICLKF